MDNRTTKVLNLLIESDKLNQINWTKTIEKFIYVLAKTNVALYDIKYGWYEVRVENFIKGQRHKYHTHGSPEEHFNMMVELDIEYLINWEKTMERFVYKAENVKCNLYDKIYGWYEVTPNKYKSGRRHKYHTHGSPKERLEMLISCDVDSLIDWDKTMERFVYNGMLHKSWFYDIDYGWFSMLPNNFKAGQRHNKRKSYGFNPHLPAILYVIKVPTFDESNIYKVGISNNNISKRFNRNDINILKVLEFENGLCAYNLEQLVLSEIKRLGYKHVEKNKVDLVSGYTESFEYNMLDLVIKMSS